MFEDGACHDVEPFQVFFTAGSISQEVRNDTRLDDTIETAMEGGLRLDRFPPAEPVRHEGKRLPPRAHSQLETLRGGRCAALHG